MWGTELLGGGLVSPSAFFLLCAVTWMCRVVFGFVTKTHFICSCFCYGPHFYRCLSSLPASQGWAQQGQRLALTRIKPMRKFEFIGPYLLATCGALWANGRIGSLLPFSKACFLANRHLSNMTIGHRRNSWRGLLNYLFIWKQHE